MHKRDLMLHEERLDLVLKGILGGPAAAAARTKVSKMHGLGSIKEGKSKARS